MANARALQPKLRSKRRMPSVLSGLASNAETNRQALEPLS